MPNIPYIAMGIHSSVHSSSKAKFMLENVGTTLSAYFSFALLGFMFIAGISLNVFYIWWSRYTASTKGCNRTNAFLQSISLANLILLVALPLDAGYLVYGSWVFNKELCSVYQIITRSMFFTIASILVHYNRDSFQPYGFPKGRGGLSTSWVIGVVPFLLLYFTSLKVDTDTGVIRCIPMQNSVFAMPACVALEMFYIAGLPVLSRIYYKNKYQYHSDYEFRGVEDLGKTESRDLCSKLSMLLLICYLPWRCIVIFNLEWKYNFLSLHMILFGVLPMMLSYALTVAFPILCITAEKGFDFSEVTGKTYIAVKQSAGSDQAEKNALISDVHLVQETLCAPENNNNQ